MPKDSVYVSAKIMASLEELLIENDVETYVQYQSKRGVENLMKPNKKKKNANRKNSKSNTFHNKLEINIIKDTKKIVFLPSSAIILKTVFLTLVKFYSFYLSDNNQL